MKHRREKLRKVKKMAAKFLTGLAVIVSVILVNTTNSLVTPPEELSIEDVTRVRINYEPKLS